MQYQLSNVGLLLLAVAVVLGGVVNNTLSALCVLMSFVCWFAVIKTDRGLLLGLLAACGWLFVAAVIATAFQ